MRTAAVLTLIGILAGLMGFASSPAGAEWAKGDPQIRMAQRDRGPGGRAIAPSGPPGTAIRQEIEEWITAWQGVSPQNQAALNQAWQNAVAGVKGLTPAQKQKIKAAAQGLAQRFQNLSPAQKARLQQQFQQATQAYAALTAAQKQQILTAMANAIEGMGTLTPAQKAQMKANYQRLLGL